MKKLEKEFTQRQLRVGEMIKQALSLIFISFFIVFNTFAADANGTPGPLERNIPEGLYFIIFSKL